MKKSFLFLMALSALTISTPAYCAGDDFADEEDLVPEEGSMAKKNYPKEDKLFTEYPSKVYAHDKEQEKWRFMDQRPTASDCIIYDVETFLKGALKRLQEAKEEFTDPELEGYRALYADFNRDTDRSQLSAAMKEKKNLDEETLLICSDFYHIRPPEDIFVQMYGEFFVKITPSQEGSKKNFTIKKLKKLVRNPVNGVVTEKTERLEPSGEWVVTERKEEPNAKIDYTTFDWSSNKFYDLVEDPSYKEKPKQIEGMNFLEKSIISLVGRSWEMGERKSSFSFSATLFIPDLHDLFPNINLSEERPDEVVELVERALKELSEMSPPSSGN